MNRLVVPAPARGVARAAAAADGDKFLTRVYKYIPTEVVAGYLLLQGIIEGATQNDPLRAPAAWGMLGLGMLATVLYLNTVGQDTKTKWANIAISVVAFLLWAYALGGPFKLGEPPHPDLYYRPWLASVFSGAASWLLGAIKLREPPPPPPAPPPPPPAAG